MIDLSPHLKDAMLTTDAAKVILDQSWGMYLLSRKHRLVEPVNPGTVLGWVFFRPFERVVSNKSVVSRTVLYSNSGEREMVRDGRCKFYRLVSLQDPKEYFQGSCGKVGFDLNLTEPNLKAGLSLKIDTFSIVI